jgi:hypothetical protein
MSMETVYNTRGRPMLFTPERLDQIRNLVERGHTREQIAEIVGCTPGSLAVTCSKLGISLRRPKPDNGNGRALVVVPEKKNGNGSSPPPAPPAEGQLVTLTLVIEHRGRTRKIPIQLPSEALGQLILEAEVRGMRLNELIVEALTERIQKRTIT